MNIRILQRAAILLSSAVLLSACGGDGGDAPPKNANESDRQSLLYAYPYDQQTEIATAAPVVLRFTSAVAVADAQAAITLLEGDATSTTEVAVTYNTVPDEPRGLVLTPDEDLKPLTDYTLVIDNLALAKGIAANKTLHFTTRPLQEGPKELVVTRDQFEIERQIPDASTNEPVMDFSTFRFQFTQPIDAATAHYGNAPASSTTPADTITLTDASGAVIEATLLVDGPYLTVDPKPDYLNAGETYTLTLSDGLASTYGEAFAGTTISVTPRDSSPRGEPAILVQRLTTQGTSRLTGKAINQVPVNGTLLGEDVNVTQAHSEAVEAELADVTVYPEVTPIRIPRGTTLSGSAIEEVMIGGEVPAGFGSGDVTMVFLSDATGYLVPNPYNSVRSDALRIVHLFMDVGIATEDPRANGGFTQDILHIELVGVADVDTTEGTLNIDAVSVVEPDVLGQEFGYGVLSFQLQSYPQQDDLPAEALAALEQEDTTPPELQSWVPGEDGGDLMLNQDPMILNFNEPLDRNSVKGRVHLYENGNIVDSDVEVDGASIIVRPAVALKNTTESAVYEYLLQIDFGISDLAGNLYLPDTLSAFELPQQVEGRVGTISFITGLPGEYPEPTVSYSPIILSAYPGYPCVLTEADIEAGDAGRCVDSYPGFDEGVAGLPQPHEAYGIDEELEEDDHLPVMELPANRTITVQFSKEIDSESVSLGDNFIVEELDELGVVVSTVTGDLRVLGRVLEFMPNKPWKLGAMYRYTLKSNGSSSSTQAICDGSGAICGVGGNPIQTVVLPGKQFAHVSGNIATGQPDPDRVRNFKVRVLPKQPSAGGPDFTQYFFGAESSNNVIQMLGNLPSYDQNSNFLHEKDLEVRDPDFNKIGMLPYMIQPNVQLYNYPYPEPGAEGQALDPRADQTIDPNGVLPPPNSSKVLSLAPWGSVTPETGLNAVDVGCYFDHYERWFPNDPSSSEMKPIPSECPSQKFIYLTGALAAEVTDEYVEDKGLKVLIWPGQIMTTDLAISIQLGTSTTTAISTTGGNLLRMRYEEGENGQREQPITAWIQDGPDEKSVLTAEVDLYLDALELQDNVSNTLIGSSTNLISFPIKITLSGEVSFSSDGRMRIEQMNNNDVDIVVKLYNPQGVQSLNLPLRLPAGGTLLQYISQPIKK
jgi:hypothetical protein